MILVNNIHLPLDTDFDNILTSLQNLPKFKGIKIKSAKLYRKSVDARRNDDVHFCCSVIIEAYSDEKYVLKHIKDSKIYIEEEYKPRIIDNYQADSPVIVGFGPAGIFAAYILALAGLRPIVLERGEDVKSRTKTVNSFWQGGPINPESNVQFGEGGAGTFSDGKLTTGIKDPRCRTVLKILNNFGAQNNILIDAKPHIGTDVLIDVVKNLRNEIIRLGGDIRFCHKLEKINLQNGRVVSVDASSPKGNYSIDCKNLILAIGHSARDTFSMLKDIGVEMVRKPFSVGVRIEHLQEDINRVLYGEFANHPALCAADYKLAVHLEDNRGVYTFCMCPGGYVVNASSEDKKIAINGMSYSKRDGSNANSAVLTEVLPQDLEGEDVLAGIKFQQDIEQAAYSITKGCGVPVQTVGDYLYNNGAPSSVCATVKPHAINADISKIFPDFINRSLKAGIPKLAEKLKGFDNPGALLTAPETRSSSPIRILRNDDFTSVNTKGLHPCGEGAGYAGGIISSAVDGIKCAEAVIDDISSNFSCK